MIVLFAVVQLIVISAVSADYNVTNYGADCTGQVPSTDAIAKAINDAASQGGDIVYFQPGIYLTGPIELKSNVLLDIADDTIIKFLDDPELYPPLDVTLPDGKRRSLKFTPLVRAWGQQNVSIRGNATFDGQGEIWWDRIPPGGPDGTRPIFLNFFDCNNIVLEQFTIKNSPMFNLNILYSNDTVINGIKIRNPESYHGKGANTDGINVVSVNGLHITGVDVATGDDCIAVNAWGHGKDRIPTENVLIENSYMSLGHGGVSIGSVTAGGLRNITVRNCVFEKTTRGLQIKTNRQRGGVVEDIHYENVTMNNVRWEGIAITTFYNDKDTDIKPIGDQTPFIRNITYKDIRGSSERNPIMLIGLPESPVENINIESCDIRSKKPDFKLENTRDIFINGKPY